MRIILIMLSFIITNQGWSCSCVNFVSDSKSNIDFEIEQSSWIGIGTVLSVNKQSYPAIYQLDIRTTYKGSNQIKNVESGFGGPDCEFIFEIGEEYIIYGSVTSESTIETNRCRRTNKISDTADSDYLNKVFIDSRINLNWSESFANFIQSRTKIDIDILDPPLIVNKDYQLITVEETIAEHPNYIVIEELRFNSGELKRLNSIDRENVIRSGILIVKTVENKVRIGKLIRKLNKRQKMASA